MRKVILATLLFVGQLAALEMTNSDMTLIPPPPEKPTIMGVPFGINPKSASKLISSMGLKFRNQVNGEDGFVKVMTFEGIPPGLSVERGVSRFVFFKDQLVKMDYFIEPSYTNFLVVRQKLFSKMEERFSVGEKKEEMDKFLRAHLAGLEMAGLDKRSEKVIQDSITKGKTFFFYNINDSQKQVNATYSLTASRNESNTPQLLLHYSLKSGIDEFRSHLNTIQQGAEITPQ